MAEVLTVVAEEMGRVFGMVWSGVGVAVRLNNQVMTTVLKATNRIVQLLLLLTHKAADLLSILLADLLIFLGDVGNAVLALGTALQTAVTTLINFVKGFIICTMSATVYSFHLVHVSYCSVLYGIKAVWAQMGNLLIVLKQAFILFGSSVVFIISLIPSMICLLFTGLFHLFSNAYLSCSQAINDAWLSVIYFGSICSSSIINFVCDVPLEAVIGVVMGLAVMICLKYALFYMMENMILVPDVPLPSLFMVMRQRFIRWYMAVVERAHQRPPVENDTEEEELDDANDENGNDNNDNVPDLNLPQNQLFAQQMNMPVPVPNHIQDPHADLDPLANEEVGPQNPAPLLMPVGPARRPITRQRFPEHFQEGVANPPANSFAESKQGRESTSRVDGQTIQLYRELEQEREGRLCIVCQDQVKCVILLPCRHLCLCDACRSAIITRDNTCPVCRRPILETLRVFV